MKDSLNNNNSMAFTPEDYLFGGGEDYEELRERIKNEIKGDCTVIVFRREEIPVENASAFSAHVLLHPDRDCNPSLENKIALAIQWALERDQVLLASFIDATQDSIRKEMGKTKYN